MVNILNGWAVAWFVTTKHPIQLSDWGISSFKDVVCICLSVMQVSEAFPFVSGILNEDVLVRSSCQSDSSLEKFRYFVVESSMILAFLEQTLGREQGESWYN